MKFRRILLASTLLLAGPALADATNYSPLATGFTLPNAQRAVSAQSADTSTYATTAGSTGYATNAGTAANAGYANSAGTAQSANSASSAGYASSAVTANAASYATNSGVAQQAAELTSGNNCPAGTALSVSSGILTCVSSVTSITGQIDGSQIVGQITNVSGISTSGNITANGLIYGVSGLFTDNAVFSNTYVDRGGGAGAVYYGTATSANYAASSVVGILRQTQPGDGSTYYCDPGYHIVFYDTNVLTSNNAFFYECIQDGH